MVVFLLLAGGLYSRKDKSVNLMPESSGMWSLTHPVGMKVPVLASAFLPVCSDQVTLNLPPAVLPDSGGSSWESSSWEKQRGEVKEHLCQGGLYLDSIHRGFTLDDRNALLRWSNLQPTCWPAGQDTEAVPPADCPGYYQVTILGKDVAPVQSVKPLFQEAGCTFGFCEAVLGNSIL